MSKLIGVDRAGATRDWQLLLECGHEIAVPWGSVSPAVMACIVHHREQCETPTMEFVSGTAWRVAPVFRAPVPTFR
jgi:hypothetical protein